MKPNSLYSAYRKKILGFGGVMDSDPGPKRSSNNNTPIKFPSGYGFIDHMFGTYFDKATGKWITYPGDTLTDNQLHNAYMQLDNDQFKGKLPEGSVVASKGDSPADQNKWVASYPNKYNEFYKLSQKDLKKIDSISNNSSMFEMPHLKNYAHLPDPEQPTALMKGAASLYKKKTLAYGGEADGLGGGCIDANGKPIPCPQGVKDGTKIVNSIYDKSYIANRDSIMLYNKGVNFYDEQLNIKDKNPKQYPFHNNFKLKDMKAYWGDSPKGYNYKSVPKWEISKDKYNQKGKSPDEFATKNIRFINGKKVYGTQPEVLTDPSLYKAKGNIQITSPQQSQMPVTPQPQQGKTNWSFVYPKDASGNMESTYFNNQQEYDAALKTATGWTDARPLMGNSNFMYSSQQGDEHSALFRGRPKYENGGTMGLYQTYRKKLLAYGGGMEGFPEEIPPVIGGGPRGGESSLPGTSTSNTRIPDTGTGTGTSITPGKESDSKNDSKINWGAVATTGAGLINGMIDSSTKGDPLTGRMSQGSTIAKSTLTGAAMGTQVLPGIGTAIGAVVGAVGGVLSSGKQKREARADLSRRMWAERANELNQSSAMVATNPQLATGYHNSSYYAANGGYIGNHSDITQFAGTGTEVSAPIAHLYMNGGKAKSLSSDNALLVGNSHAQGGIDIPELGSNVEGGETTKDNYIFSKKLGFADLHKPIAQAKGIIEGKPMTQDRINALKKLNGREKELMLAQEYMKKQLGVK